MAKKKHLSQYDSAGNRQEIYLNDDEVMTGGKTLENKLAEIDEALGNAGKGSVSGVKVNGTTHAPDDQGVVDIGTVITQHQDISGKVDKVAGKGLSTNDYTDADKTKVDGMKAVATSGSYNDLTDKPTIPAGVVVDPELSDTSENAVQNKVVKAAIDRIQEAIDALTGTGDTTAAINTMNEVATFLAGVTNNETLVGKLNELRTLINAKYTKPANGIPASDLADGVIPTNVSELTNDAGYQTQAQVAEAISQAAIEAVVGNGDFAMTYDQASDTFNIVRIVPTLQVTQLSSLSASTKSGTFKVSGTNLKGNVTIAIAITATGWTLSDGTNTGQTLTLVPTDGTLAETTITATYSGSTDSVGNTITVSSTNAESKTVTANYTVVAGPTIFADTSKTIQAIAGDSATATIEVAASQLTEGITVIKGNDNANKFTVSPTSLGTSGGTLTVQFSPASGDTTNQSATITLSSSGAEDVVIALTGQVLVPSLSVSPASLDFSGSAGTATSAKQVVLTGANLLNDVTVTAPTGFTVTRNGSAVSTIAKADVMASGGVTLDVVAAGTAASGSLSFTSGTLGQAVSLTWVETEIEADGGTYRRKVGYTSASSDTPDVDIVFKITTLASEGVDGEVKVVNKAGGEGYTTDQNAIYTGLKKVDIPPTLSIGNNTYKVIEIATYAFISSSLEIVNFVSPSNVKTIGNAAFRGISAFKGTGVVGGLNTMEFPSSIRSIGNGYEGTAVRRIVVPDDFSGSLQAPGTQGGTAWSWPVTHVDCGSGVTSLGANNWGYGSRLTDIILRKTGGVVKITDWAISNLSSTLSEGQLTIHVPAALVETYKASDGTDEKWKSLVDAGKATFVAITE